MPILMSPLPILSVSILLQINKVPVWIVPDDPSGGSSHPADPRTCHPSHTHEREMKSPTLFSGALMSFTTLLKAKMAKTKEVRRVLAL
jgi:hypothetical protein